jgi:hypothetical protein
MLATQERHPKVRRVFVKTSAYLCVNLSVPLRLKKINSNIWDAPVTNYWNQGIGTKILSTLVNYLFAELQAEKIVIDPNVRNTRAIRCYEKCGSEKVKILPKHELHEKEYRDSWLMVRDRNKSLN